MNYLIDSVDNYKKLDYSSMFCKISIFKQEKINKMKNQKRKAQSILGEILLKKGLYIYYGIDYNVCEFSVNKYGKSFIKNTNIEYNISHSNDFVICAFSNNIIGVDIEYIRKTNLNTTNFFATSNEKDYIFKNEYNQYKRLFEIYTLKEAYFKMKGITLENLKSVEFCIDSLNKVICSDNTVKCFLSNEIDNYIVAFCEKK